IDEDHSAAAALDVADFYQDVFDGEGVGGDGEVFAEFEGHGFLDFDELTADLPGGVEEGEVLGGEVAHFHGGEGQGVAEGEHGGGGGAGGEAERAGFFNFAEFQDDLGVFGEGGFVGG